MNEIFNKIKFFLRRPRVVVISNENRQMAREAICQVLRQHFRVGNEVLIFEANATELENFQFFLKKSPFSILVSTQGWVEIQEKKVGSKKLTFGFQDGADFQASDIKVNGGTNFKINHKGNIVPVWLRGVANQNQIYSALAAVAVGTVFGLNLVEISQALTPVTK